jgi:hypothetical protein
MSDEQKLDQVLERIEPGRRDAVRKILIGAAIYAAPVVASFSMDSLGGVAQAQSQNQTISAVPVPATSNWGMAGVVAALGAVGAFVLRRGRGR